MSTRGTDDAVDDAAATAGAGVGDAPDIIETPGAGRSRRAPRAAAAALVVVVTCLCAAASGVLGARSTPPPLDPSDVSAGDDVLSVRSEWPLSQCAAVALAGMPGPAAPPGPDGTRRGSGTSGPAVPAPPTAYRQGWLVLRLSGTTVEPLRIDDFDVEVFRADDDAAPDWALVHEPAGCGPSTRWLMDLVLADGHGELVDRGPSRVARTDPAEIHVHVSACDRYYEFGLVIEYAVDGDDRVARVGSPERPFRIVGGAAPVVRPSSGEDQARLGEALLFPSCP